MSEKEKESEPYDLRMAIGLIIGSVITWIFQNPFSVLGVIFVYTILWMLSEYKKEANTASGVLEK